MEAFDEDVVLQTELEHRQHRPGQVEGIQVPAASGRHHGHDGEVADEELAQRSGQNKPHVQAAGGVFHRNVLPAVQPVDDAADHSGEAHQAHYHRVGDEMKQQGLVSVLLILPQHVHTMNGTSPATTSSIPVTDPKHTSFRETDIFPHDVGQSRSEEAVFYVERLQVLEGLFEGFAHRVTAITLAVITEG